MFKSVALLAVIAFTAASAGIIGSHTIVAPSVAKIGAVVHSVPSAVSHQSFTRVHNKAEIRTIVAPVVRTVHVAPIVETVPIVKTIAVAPVVKTVHVAPVIKTYTAPVVSHVRYATPLVKAYAATPVVHAAPLVKSVW